MKETTNVEATSKLKAVNHRAKGGLVLKRAELQTILGEEGAVGLAFGVVEPGTAFDVDLQVYKVIKGEVGLEGEPRRLTYRKGASELKKLDGETGKYCFEYDEELQKCGFDFAYLPKTEFNRLFSNGEDEVFISGVIKDYGKLGTPKGKWFTLSATPRLNPTLEKLLGNPPKNYFMEACPPFWTPDGSDGEEGPIIVLRK